MAVRRTKLKWQPNSMSLNKHIYASHTPQRVPDITMQGARWRNNCGVLWAMCSDCGHRQIAVRTKSHVTSTRNKHESFLQQTSIILHILPGTSDDESRTDTHEPELHDTHFIVELRWIGEWCRQFALHLHASICRGQWERKTDTGSQRR